MPSTKQSRKRLKEGARRPVGEQQTNVAWTPTPRIQQLTLWGLERTAEVPLQTGGCFTGWWLSIGVQRVEICLRLAQLAGHVAHDEPRRSLAAGDGAT